MKKLSLFLLTCLMATPAFAAKEVFDPNALFQCRPDQENATVEVSLHKRLRGIGPQKFVGVIRTLGTEGEIIEKAVRLNLENIYEGRIVNFTSADLRVRFDRVKVIEQKMKTFMQIPALKVYTDDWTCKGPSFEEMPIL